MEMAQSEQVRTCPMSFEPNFLAVWLALPVRIRKMPGSVLGSKTDNPARVFRVFRLSFKANSEVAVQDVKTPTAFF